VTRRHRFVAKYEMALRTNKRGALVSLVNFVVENPTVVSRGGDVTTFSAATRLHRHPALGRVRYHSLMAL